MPASDCVIRPYAPDDLVPVVALWYRAWHESHPGERHVFAIEEWQTRWRERMVPGAAIHVAIVDGGGVVAGYVAVVAATPWSSHVVVTPEYRRRGIGARLVEAAKAASPAGLVFDVFTADAAARNFYASCGFLAGEAVVHPPTGQAMIRYTWAPAAAIE